MLCGEQEVLWKEQEVIWREKRRHQRGRNRQRQSQENFARLFQVCGLCAIVPKLGPGVSPK
jgi:hypothetical protein